MENQVSIEKILKQRRLWAQKNASPVSTDIETLTVQRLRRQQNGIRMLSPDIELYELFPRLSAGDQCTDIAVVQPSHTPTSPSSKCKKRRRGREEDYDAEHSEDDDNKVGEDLLQSSRPRFKLRRTQE